MKKKVVLLLHSNKGHSLIEISIGLAIIALIMTIVLPYGNSIIVQAKTTIVQRNLRSLVQYCEEYFIQYGSWPKEVGQNIQLVRNGKLLILKDGDNTSVAYPRLGSLASLAYAQHQH